VLALLYNNNPVGEVTAKQFVGSPDKVELSLIQGNDIFDT
jgi:hypothetical protein